jgi:hypothetical protein
MTDEKTSSAEDRAALEAGNGFLRACKIGDSQRRLALSRKIAWRQAELEY